MAAAHNNPPELGLVGLGPAPDNKRIDHDTA